MKEIKKQTIKASVWTIFGFGVSQIMRLGSNLVLTRLLIPELFGLMAIVSVIRLGIYLCSEIGLKVNIIRHENAEVPRFVNTAWTMQVVRGFILWLLAVLVAFIIYKFQGIGFFPEASVYTAAELPIVIVITTLSLIILGFESSNVWLAQRQMTLGKITRIELLSQLAGICVMVAWAMRSPGIWALVAGTLVPTFIKTLLSHTVLPGKRNYFCWDKQIALELLHFGKWLFLSSMVTFFAFNGDRLLLGGFLTAEELGFYTVAFFLATALRDMLEKLNFKVWYPLLCKICREDKEKVATVYYSIRAKQDILVFFVIGFLYVLAPIIVDVLYDDRYATVGWMLQILVFTLIGSCYRLGGYLMTAMGNPKIGTFAIASRAVALWGLTPFSYHYYGLSGALWCIALNSLFDLPVIWWSFFKHGIIRWIREVMFFPFIGLGYGAGLFVLKMYKYT